jgi:NAD(P)-dependent dehydrogenase (short-subunit alcohol dehydrogenase family)
LLINNAAIMASPLLRDSRGYEGQFSTNHLGHFQLTARLWPALLKARMCVVRWAERRACRMCVVRWAHSCRRRRGLELRIAPVRSVEVIWAIENRKHPVRAGP